MKKILSSLLFVILIFSITGCSSAIEQTLSPEQATGTAIMARMSTDIAEATLYPATPFPTDVYPTMDWVAWTPSSEEIVASDSGKTFNFVMTSRFSIVLKEAGFPAANLKLNCVPDIVLGRISNVEPVSPDYYVVRYEGSGFGQCIIQNGSFEVTINITEHPFKTKRNFGMLVELLKNNVNIKCFSPLTYVQH